MVEYIVGSAAALLFARTSHRVYRKHLRPKIKGYLGEWGVRHDLNKLASEDTLLLHDMLLSTGKDTTQIDHIVVSRYGIFYIETKNYSGLISGNEWDKTWEQRTDKSLHPIPNPVRQNYKHSLAIKKALAEHPHIPIYPIVVFSNKSHLDVTSERTLVIHRRDLLPSISTLSQNAVLTTQQVQHIKKQLEASNILDPAERRKHKEHVRIRKELFGSDELSKAYEEGKDSPIVQFSPQLTMAERFLQEKLVDYHAHGPLLTIRGKTATIDYFLQNARRNQDGTVAEPGMTADHMICPYTGTSFPLSELPNLERGLWLSYFNKNPELASYISTKEGFAELFPSRTRASSLASAYVNAPVSATMLVKNTDWYRNLEETFQKPAVEEQILSASTKEDDPSISEDTICSTVHSFFEQDR